MFYLKRIVQELFKIGLFFYLFLIIIDYLTDYSFSRFFNLNWLLLSVNFFGILSLLLIYLVKGEQKEELRFFKWRLIMSLPFMILLFYLLWQVWNPHSLPRVYLYDFCKASQRISYLTPRRRVSKIEQEGECFALLRHALVYFVLRLGEKEKALSLEIQYKSNAEKMSLGIEEERGIKILHSLPMDNDLSIWQRINFQFNLKDLYFKEGKKLKFVFVTQGLPARDGEEFIEDKDPTVMIDSIKMTIH